MVHIYSYKARETIFMRKVKDLLEDRPSNLTTKLKRQRGKDLMVARELRRLSDANRRLHLHGEGIQQVKKASEVYDQLGDVVQRTRTLTLVDWRRWTRHCTTCKIDLNPEKGQEHLVCSCRRVLGGVYPSKSEKEKG